MSKCSGLHCPGCGDSAGSGLGVIICVIVGLLLAGGAVKVASAADKIILMIEHIVIIAGITIGALSIATVAGVCTVRLRRRSVARAHAREPLYRAQVIPAVSASWELPELPASAVRDPDGLTAPVPAQLRALPPAASMRARVLRLRMVQPDDREPR